MKKLMSIILVVLCTVGLLACSSNPKKSQEATTQESGTAQQTAEGMPNPIVELNTKDELLEKLGGNVTILLPEEATELEYSFITGAEVGQVNFQFENDKYTQRVKKTKELEDISGMYVEFETTKDMVREGEDYQFTIRFNEGKEGVSQWFDLPSNVSYSVSMDTGATEAKLARITDILIPAG